MNDNETNFDSTHPLEPGLEARVVAWVLGEASPFEAAELERRCAEEPELAVFKRRIAAVHGLLGEAARPAGTAWRLAPERRAALLEKLTDGAVGAGVASAGKVLALPVERRRGSGWRAWVLPVAACLALGGLLVAIVLPTIGTVRELARLEPGPMRPAPVATIAPADGVVRSEEAHDFGLVVQNGARLAQANKTEPPASVQFNLPVLANGPVEAPVAGKRALQAKSAPASRFAAAPAAPAAMPAPAPAPSVSTAPASVMAPAARRQADLREFAKMAGERSRDSDAKDALADSLSARSGAGTGLAERAQALVGANNDYVFRGSAANVPVQRGASMTFAGGTVVSGGILNNTLAYESRTTESEALPSSEPEAPEGYAGGATGANDRSLWQVKDQSLVQAQPLAKGGKTDASKESLPLGLVFFDAEAASGGANSSLSLTGDKVVASESGTSLVTVTGRAGQELAAAAQPALSLEKAKALGGRVSSEAELKLKEADLPAKPASVAPAADESLRAEVAAQEQAVSTFSLHVSDASFRLAKAALERGEAPDPAAIRPEEFYNAFDYGDPAPATGEPVACRVEQAAHPFLQQRNLVRIALRVPAAGRGAGTPLHLTVLLDTSGSMEREDRAATVRAALTALAALLGPEDRVTLVGFARQPRLLAENLPGDQAGRLAELAAQTPAEGGTNLEEALKLAGELALRQLRPGAQNRIVLLTDGAANLGDADPARLAGQVETLRRQGVAFDACGVGAAGLDDGVLEALTRRGDGRYQVLNSPEEADAGFARKLAGAFRPAAENVKVQVRFNPARVARYRLIGFEKHRLREQDFRDDRVDAAELAAEEAAVALYQVEVMPGAELGELGDVAVRFRDPARGEMVERTWTLTHEAQPPAFDRASPSLRLAGVSALLAEKLRGGAPAGQIRLDELVPMVAGLRGAYAGDARVGDFLRMFDQARRLTGE